MKQLSKKCIEAISKTIERYYPSDLSQIEIDIFYTNITKNY